MDNLDGYFDKLANGEILERKKRSYVLKQDFTPEEAFTEERESLIGPDYETLTKETLTLHKLGCSHVAGAIGARELIGFCEVRGCNASICFRCDCHCDRCHSRICPHHIRLFRNLPFCPRCRIIEWLKRGTIFSLKGIHTLLSKEF